MMGKVIVELSVENVAIIERAALSLGPGYSALTGETGAGKSLFVDALELAFGARADTDLVRSGARQAVVAVTIDLSQNPELERQCLEMGAATEDHLLYLQREVFAEGRSQCRIGGKLAPLSLLKQLGALLVDLHGQHDHQSLLHSERHIGFLDAWIGTEAVQGMERVRTELDSVRSLERRLAAIRQGRREREHRLDLLRFQVNEIASFGPVEGEFAALQAEEARLAHAERIGTLVDEAAYRLAEREVCAVDEVNGALKLLDEAARLDPSLEERLEPFRTAAVLLADGFHDLRAYRESVEADPLRLQEVAERIDGYRTLFKKYGDDEAAVREHFERAEAELAELEGDESSEEDLAGALEDARQRLQESAEALSALRKLHAEDFSKQVQAQLRDLAMDSARFEVRFEPKQPDVDGIDLVEFGFSANLGEPLRPLSKIASGGEISRAMLAIKTVSAGKAGVPTLIFDEVDVGLGGRAAAVVAKKLEELAQFYQVIVISHLPQIASRAVAHFHIRKSEEGGRVATRIEPLSEERRVEEIARMIAGEQVTDAARQHAKEMLSLR